MLGMIAFVLAIIWIVAFFVFHIGGWIHILIVAALIMTLVRIARTTPVR